MTFEFGTAARVVFGPGTTRGAAAIVKGFGKRALVVTGRPSPRSERFLKLLRDQAVDCQSFSIGGEPTVVDVVKGAAKARAEGCDVLVGFGGGSAIDAAKAIAAVSTNGGDPLDFLEVVGRGKPMLNAPLPYMAIPTTAGTGAEVTRNAVLGSPEHGVKASLRSPGMLAKVALVDPELTRDLPAPITAYTGCDALTQLLEAYVSTRAQPITDALCTTGLAQAGNALERAVANGADTEAREAMSLASLLSGIALANAGLGAVHGFAAPLGGMLSSHHGAVCAALLPHATAVNITALRERQPQSPALRKYDEAARLLFGPHATADELPALLLELCRRIGIKPLAALGFDPSQIPIAAEKGAQASSMKANPLPLTSAELHSILEASLAS